ncbi:uncharacterized protein [Ptychodera flava]|uniref:uncharacterized protein n=1 Tax=Ptychodera flava TaxID=63121 RepID=UPI00396AAC02
MTDRFPSPTQDANQNVSEDRYETDPKSVTLLNVQDANVDFEEEEEEMAGMIVLDTINLVEETQVDENDTTAETTVETETSLTQDSEVTGIVNYSMEAEGALAGDVEECERPADLGSETQASMN